MKKIVIIILIFLLAGCGKKEEQPKIEFKSITAGEVNRMMNEESNFKIIDVRTKAEYDSGHIVGAINIPLDTISNIQYDKNTEIIVYCQSGARSKQAAQKLVDLGYINVFDLGGISTWPYEIVEE